jgi:glycosyltransferase
LPRLSIITVSHNSRATLEHCILSVASQDVDKEHVLVDGASDDGTHKVIERHRDRFSTVISEPDEGIYDAMNKGIRAAKGVVIGFLNADDFYPEPGVLEPVIEAFEDPDVEACYGDLVYVRQGDISKTTRYWKSGDFSPQKFYHGWMPPHPAFFVRREVFEKYGLFNTRMGSAADYELMLRFLVRYKLKAAYIPRVLVHMRTGGVSNASLANRIQANRKDREAWEVNGLRPYPWTLWAKPLRKVGQWVKRPR